MSNGGRACCILGLCCLIAAMKQRLALKDEIKEHYPNMSDEDADQASAEVLAYYDGFRHVRMILAKYHGGGLASEPTE